MPVRLHVEETGTGSPLIALHGFGASTFTWRSVMDDLAQSHHVHAVDLKGSGQSPKPPDGRYSMRDQSALILALIAERALTGITIVGHSFGGGVALLTALELVRTRPGALASLILFDAPAYRQPIPAFIRVLTVPLLGPLFQAIAPLSFQVRTVLRIAFHNDALIDDDLVGAYVAPLRMPGGRRALRDTARQVVPNDIDAVSRRYGSIDVPTLLIWGRHDTIVPLAVGERLHAAIPGSRLVVLDDCGHVPQEETPEHVRPVVRAFLSVLSATKREGRETL